MAAGLARPSTHRLPLPNSVRRNAIVWDTASDRRVRMSDIPSWHIVGEWFDNCSCAVPCPCTFAQAPDNGFCESVLFWHVREGHYGDVKLDNLSFVRVGRWEGDLWARNATGVAGLYIDDHADDRQMEALPAIIGGRSTGLLRRQGVAKCHPGVLRRISNLIRYTVVVHWLWRCCIPAISARLCRA